MQSKGRVSHSSDPIGRNARHFRAGFDEHVAMDFFRLYEYGKIVGHWDTAEQIPDQTGNRNPNFLARGRTISDLEPGKLNACQYVPAT